jgi:fido (protein-threonine AMPylation protein)
LAVSGYTDIDPQAPLGGPDDKKDILARRSAQRFVAAVFFPPTHQAFASIKRKFVADREGVARHNADGFVFMVNQPLTLGERQELEGLGGPRDEIYHLERLRHVLDSPQGYGLRLEYLRRPMTAEDQIAFFSTLNPDLTQRFVGRDRLGAALDATSGDDSERQAVISATTEQPDAGDGKVLGDVAAPMSQFNVATLILLHRRVMAGSPMPAAVRGQLRTVQTWISDGSAEPVLTLPAPDQIPGQLKEALHWWQGAYPALVGAPEEDVILALARLCQEIMTIHPFIDGNKRLALAIVDLAAVELLGRGISAELPTEALDHLDALLTPRGEDLTELARFVRAALV